MDPESFPDGETSGTGLITYAYAWGVNNHYLDKAEYLPVIRKAWQALNSVVKEDRMVCWVQQIGDQPQPTSADTWEEYGTGAYLLAASEVIKLVDELKK